MDVKIVHNRSELNTFFKNKDTYNYMYQINNLDDREWSNVICYGLYESTDIKQIAMLYIGYEVPVLLAASFENNNYNKELIKKIKNYLPSEFYTHMDKETLKYVFDDFEISSAEEYVNMGIDNGVDISIIDKDNAVSLNVSSINEINRLFEENYPENWLDEKLLELNDNYGIRVNDKLLSFAGVHAYSLQYKVATIAHATTDKNHRNKGYARDCIVALIKDLREKVEFIGLNVRTNNDPAIKCYKNIGFKECGKYIACDIKLNSF